MAPGTPSPILLTPSGGVRGGTYDVCEVFSPARISEMASKQGLRGGWSLDLSQPCKVTGRTWDCLNEEDRAWAKRRVHQDKPEL